MGHGLSVRTRGDPFDPVRIGVFVTAEFKEILAQKPQTQTKGGKNEEKKNSSHYRADEFVEKQADFCPQKIQGGQYCGYQQCGTKKGATGYEAPPPDGMVFYKWQGSDNEKKQGHHPAKLAVGGCFHPMLTV